MASSNKTPNYNLPQYAENDTIEFTPEINTAFSTIDAGMKANADNIGLLNTILSSAPMVPSGASLLDWILTQQSKNFAFSTQSGVLDLPSSVAEWTAGVGLVLRRNGQPHIVLFGLYGSVAVINRLSNGWQTWRINSAD